jgi:hypothetical protein
MWQSSTGLGGHSKQQTIHTWPRYADFLTWNGLMVMVIAAMPWVGPCGHLKMWFVFLEIHVFRKYNYRYSSGTWYQYSTGTGVLSSAENAG